MSTTESSLHHSLKTSQDFEKMQNLFEILIQNIVIDHKNETLVPSSTLNQIKLDVDRSFNYIENATDKSLYKSLLKNTLNKVFEIKPKWFYYQGYHDIVAFFLYQLTYIENGTVQFKKCDNDRLLLYIIVFTENFLKDFMTKDLNNAMVYLNFIPKILKKYNMYNYQIFKNKPFYGSIANIMTLFTHNISQQNIPIRLKIMSYLLESKNISFILVFYTKLISHFKLKIEERVLNNSDSGNDPLVLQSLINTLITDELDKIDLNELEKLLKESFDDMNSPKIQNIFKYSYENNGLLINFDYKREKIILKNTLLVAVNMIMLKKMTPDITSPYTFAGTVLTINNIHRLIRYYTLRYLK